MDYLIGWILGLSFLGFLVWAGLHGRDARVAAAATAEVTLDGNAYAVHTLVDKGSGKTLRCIMYDRSLIILPDAIAERSIR
jgi:hypothetical protein